MPHRLGAAGLSILGMALIPQVLAAQTSLPASALPQSAEAVIASPTEPNRELKDGKVLRALRINGAVPVIDGGLSDEIWMEAARATGFVQRDPDNGKPMTEDTYVQIAYDDRYLYVAVTCIDATPDAIRAGLSRRDEMGATDIVTIGFDARHDHQTAFAFQTNPSAVQVDMSYFNDESQDRDYNAVWDVRTGRSERGWTAEYRIPFSQLRFTAAPEPGQVWGFNAAREIKRRGETGSWIPRPRGVRGDVSLFGHLVFDAPLPAPRRLELVPYLAARSENVPASDIEAGASAGLDIRMGIGTGATLSGTFNPDFGQVEQDPAVLNLSVFETFFPEKRPFFLEDSRTFVPPYGLFQVFHSRRIGRAPGRLPLAAGERLLGRPDDTTILGATKLTGKGSGWTYGAMTALTSREYAQIESPTTHADGTTTYVRGERLIEPATSYSVARVQRDVMNGTSNVGGIFTGVVREHSDDAFTGGIDYSLRWDSNRVNWNGHWVTTRAPGPGGMKTSGGGITNFSVSRKHVNVSTHYDHFGKDLRLTDIGFFRSRGNRNQVNGGIEVGNPDPWKKLRSIWGFTYWNNDWTDEKLLIGRYQESGVNIRFMNFWQVVGGGWRGFDIYDDLDTRGGPPISRPGNVGAFYRVNSDSRKRWSFNFYGNRWRSDVGRTGGNWSPGFSYQPSDRLQTSIALNYNYGVDDAQWITNQDANGDGVLDHVYGTLTRDVVDITLRGTYAFSRDLTLQAYLQPFVAVGDYENTRRLAGAKTYDFEPVAIPFDPDFNRKSLRGNIVMRWECRPGSTLFVVWDLSQADLSRPGDFSPLRDLRTAFGAEATHIFMVKTTYWLNR
jgi:hypothetical protein